MMGKTTIALNIYKELLENGTKKAAFLTTHQTKEGIEDRLDKMMSVKSSYNIIDVASCDSIDALCDIIQKTGADVVFLDSMHFMSFFYCVDVPNYYEYLAGNSLRLKQLTKKLAITLIITCRTNYQVNQREGVSGIMPILSDGDMMGDWGYFCDEVYGVYRPEVDCVMVDTKGYDMRGALYVLHLKTKSETINQYEKYRITPKTGALTLMETGERSKLF
jgi:hypothetical protein